MNRDNVIEARYCGRSAAARDLLIQLREYRERVHVETESLVHATRRTLAKTARSLRARAAKQGKRNAERAAAVRLADELISARAQIQRKLDDMKSQCVTLSLRISEEVLGEKIAELSETTAARIERALAELRTSQLVRIEVHPSDYTAVQRRLGKTLAQMSCELGRSETVAHGAVRIVTGGGSVAVDWREHLDHLKSEILRSLQTPQGARVRA